MPVELGRSAIAAALLPSACRYGCCPDGVSAAQGPNNLGCPQYYRDVQVSGNQPTVAAPTVSTQTLCVLAIHQIRRFRFNPGDSDYVFLLCFISASNAGERILQAWHQALWPTLLLFNLGHPPVIPCKQGTEWVVGRCLRSRRPSCVELIE